MATVVATDDWPIGSLTLARSTSFFRRGDGAGARLGALPSGIGKAAVVDPEKLAGYQTSCALVDAESCLKDAFSTDVRPAIREWAVSKGLPADAMDAFRQSGYLEKITADRGAKNMSAISSYA